MTQDLIQNTVSAQSDNGIIITDANGMLEYVNEGFVLLHGYTLDDFKLLTKGNSLFETTSNKDLKNLVANCIVEKKSFTYDSINTTKSGDEKFIQTTVFPIFKENGMASKLVFIDVDKTESKAAKELVLKQKNEIEKSFQNIKLLSEIGQQITSTLSVETIVEQVYERINQLMDAAIFGIGVYNKNENKIYFPAPIENGKKLSTWFASLDEENRTPVWCFKNQKEVIINDFETEYNKYIKNIVKPKAGGTPSSIIYLPLTINDEKIGVITVQSFQKNVYADYQLNLLRNLAVYVAIAVGNARLYESVEATVKKRTEEVTKQKEELENSHKNIQLLSDIGQQITSSLSVEKIIETVYENINKLMDASSFWIGIYSEKEQRLNYPMGIEKGEILPSAFYNLSEKERLPVWSFLNQKEVFVNDYLKDYYNYIPNGTPPVPVVGDMPVSSIWYPLIAKNKSTLGILTIQSFNKNSYTDYHLSIVKSMAVFISIALENALLYEQVEEKVRERTKEVMQQKEELEKINQEIIKKNKSLTDSIQYAKRIQQALLGDEKHASKNLPTHFILFKPRDIVSGDFYWILEKGNMLYIAAADCTGHGVPGAFLTMLGASYLNEIVANNENIKPAEILNQLRDKFVKELGYEGKSKDGMDISLAQLNLETNKIEWSGANNPLWIIKNLEPQSSTSLHDTFLQEIKPDKQPIGYSRKYSNFTNHTLQLTAGDSIYLITDGYADQFGGEEGKKMMKKKLKEILVHNVDKPMNEQHSILNDTFEMWKGNQKQIDDVTIIGIKL